MKMTGSAYFAVTINLFRDKIFMVWLPAIPCTKCMCLLNFTIETGTFMAVLRSIIYILFVSAESLCSPQCQGTVLQCGHLGTTGLLSWDIHHHRDTER